MAAEGAANVSDQPFAAAVRLHPSRWRARITTLALCAWLLPTSTIADVGNPLANDLVSLRQLGSAAGLPQLTVFALAEDAAGHVYAGTQDGLSRWDGRRFVGVPLAGGARDWVTHLHRGVAGLWIGTDGNGLQHLQGGQVREVLADDGQRLPSIEAFADDAGDGLLVGTPQGLFRCLPASCRALPGTHDLQVAELLRDGAGRLWVGTNIDGLYRFDPAPEGGYRRSDFHLGRSDGLPNDAVRALLLDPHQRLWIGTGRGLARWDGARLQRWMQTGDTPLGGVTALRQLPQGEVLAALWGRGMARIRSDDSLQVIGTLEGMPDTYLHALLLGGDPADPIVWAGTGSGGVLRLEPGRWRSFDERHGLPQRVVVGVGEWPEADATRTLWAGTLGGAVALRGGRWAPLLPPAYRDRIVYDVLSDPRGRRWYATHRGLLLEEHGRWRALESDEAQLPATSVDQLAWVGGRVWLATGHGLAAMRDDGQAERLLRDIPNGEDLAVRAMLPLAAEGDVPRVLLASSLGLVLTDGRALVPAGRDCRPRGTVYDIERLANGEIWLGTRDGALRLDLDSAEPRCIPVAEPAGGALTVYEIAQDRAGRVYLFGYDGVRRIDDPTAAATDSSKGYRRFGLEDGLPSLEFNRDALVDAGGRLWAANADGLVAFDPDAQLRAPQRARLALDARSDGAPLEPGARLAAGHGEIEFAPRLLSFRHEHLIRYRTQLVGLDPQAGAWLADGDRRYPRLPPGDYRFEVSARDAAGRIHGPEAVAFSVAAPWWQQPLALLLAALALLGAGLGLGRMRARALTRRAAQLEQLVAERTRELALASSTDPLTQAWNRRYFHQQVSAWLREAGDPGLMLLLIDIDHFKQINDRHGHAAGDAVLVAVAARLRQSAGNAGELIRWGGEEFLMVLRAVPPAAVEGRVAGVLQAVAASPVDFGSEAIGVRCSIGYTRCRPPADGIDQHIDLVIQRADRALYAAKQAGRNRAVAAD